MGFNSGFKGLNGIGAVTMSQGDTAHSADEWGAERRCKLPGARVSTKLHKLLPLSAVSLYVNSTG